MPWAKGCAAGIFSPALSEHKRIFPYSIRRFWSFRLRSPRSLRPPGGGLFILVHTCSFPAKGCQGVSWFRVESGAATSGLPNRLKLSGALVVRGLLRPRTAGFRNSPARRWRVHCPRRSQCGVTGAALRDSAGMRPRQRTCGLLLCIRVTNPVW
jgi:hypothetical protein